MSKTSYENYIKFEVISKKENVTVVCNALAEFIEPMDCDKETIGEIIAAVEEGMLNCVSHAYKEKIGIITVTVKIVKGNTVNVIIKDNGVGIANVEEVKKPFYSESETKGSGMGFLIMETFSTKFKVVSTPGKGTTVHLKRIVK